MYDLHPIITGSQPGCMRLQVCVWHDNKIPLIQQNRTSTTIIHLQHLQHQETLDSTYH